LELLATRQVGRLGFISGGGPEILPVNYALDGDAVVFATATGAKLWGTTRAAVVFEVDDTDTAAREGWSVVIHGVAQEVTEAENAALVDRIRELAPTPWPPGERPHLVRVAPASMTGRRVLPHPI
jgi:nitroimidazol reductase NimA-like FMN-containing flavoprotein (pyridoxamine 5'-phosphate oxidase superfamily)